jgi:exopolysaccharide biosynthesis polyprenyl glycosylphosphotransferase
MLRRFSANFAVLSIFMDGALVALALLLSSRLREILNELSFVRQIEGVIVLPLPLLLIFPILWVWVLLLFSVYDGRKNLRIADEFGSLTLGSALAAIGMAGVLYFTYRDVSRFQFVLFFGIGYGLMLIWRAVYRQAYRLDMLKLVHKRQVLILGAGSTGHRLSEQLARRPGLGLNVAGFLDDDLKKVEHRKDVLGTLDEARRVVQDYQIDDVVVALPLSAHKRLNQMVSVLHDLPVRVWVIPDYFSLTLHKASVEEFAGIPMLDLRAPALSEYQRMIKRAFDLVLSALVMPFLLPVMALITLLIRLDSPGPILYLADRVGENGKLFKMYKFRTMVQNADQLRHLVEKTDEKGQMLFKTRDDPRITRIGKFLRRSSFDEFPQIFNIIKGEMSLVGPRPELPYLVEKYEPWQRKRFTVPQGMTGWWQVNGRSDRPMHLHTEDDLYYVQNYSIWLDLQILFKTVWVVLRGKGAY